MINLIYLIACIIAWSGLFLAIDNFKEKHHALYDFLKE